MHGLVLFDISFLLILVISDQIDFIFLGGCSLDKEKDSSKDVKRLDKSEKKKEKSPHPLDKQKILTKRRKMEMNYCS